MSIHETHKNTQTNGVNPDIACRFVFNRARYKISSQRLHSILYMAQMYHLGRYGVRLVDLQWEAKIEGPFSPHLFKKFGKFGTHSITQEEIDSCLVSSDSMLPDPCSSNLGGACQVFLEMPIQQLQKITKWQRGAWHRTFELRTLRQTSVIADQVLQDEFREHLDKHMNIGLWRGERSV